MTTQITPEVEQLVSDIFVAGQFEDKTAVLTEALRLYRQRQQKIAGVNEGAEQRNRGEVADDDRVRPSEAITTDNSRTVREKFALLAEVWKTERGPQSSIAKMAMHPAYQQIIGLGRDAVPVLLEEMERRPSHWAWALRAITGADPVPEESRGKLVETAQAWIKWGRDHGYQW
jgi:hypothetical protein